MPAAAPGEKVAERTHKGTVPGVSTPTWWTASAFRLEANYKGNEIRRWQKGHGR